MFVVAYLLLSAMRMSDPPGGDEELGLSGQVHVKSPW